MSNAFHLIPAVAFTLLLSFSEVRAQSPVLPGCEEARAAVKELHARFQPDALAAVQAEVSKQQTLLNGIAAQVKADPTLVEVTKQVREIRFGPQYREAAVIEGLKIAASDIQFYAFSEAFRRSRTDGSIIQAYSKASCGGKIRRSDGWAVECETAPGSGLSIDTNWWEASHGGVLQACITSSLPVAQGLEIEVASITSCPAVDLGGAAPGSEKSGYKTPSAHKLVALPLGETLYINIKPKNGKREPILIIPRADDLGFRNPSYSISLKELEDYALPGTCKPALIFSTPAAGAAPVTDAR